MWDERLMPVFFNNILEDFRKFDVGSSVVVYVYESVCILHSCCCENPWSRIFHSSCRRVSSIWIHFCDNGVEHDKIVRP